VIVTEGKSTRGGLNPFLINELTPEGRDVTLFMLGCLTSVPQLPCTDMYVHNTQHAH